MGKRVINPFTQPTSLSEAEEKRRSEEAAEYTASADEAGRKALLDMVATEDEASIRLLALTESKTWAQEQVALALKSGREVTSEESAEMWSWKLGVAKFRILRLKKLEWEDDDGLKSSVLFVATVLDAPPGPGRKWVGRNVMLPTPYAVAQTVLRAGGFTVDRENPPSQILREIYQDVEKERALLARAGTVVVRIDCGADGVPLYANTRKGRRIMREVEVHIV